MSIGGTGAVSKTKYHPNWNVQMHNPAKNGGGPPNWNVRCIVMANNVRHVTNQKGIVIRRGLPYVFNFSGGWPSLLFDNLNGLGGG